MKKALLLAILLGGCDVTASQERETDANVCAGYGFRPGTVEFANCRMNRDQQRQAAGMAAIEQINRNNQTPTYQVVPMGAGSRPTVNCDTMAMGGGMSTTTCR
jgi:hypothetical protein